MFPIESQIKEELAELLNQEDKTKTEIAIEVMLWIMRRQMFIDGNKRVLSAINTKKNNLINFFNMRSIRNVFNHWCI